MTRKKNIMNQIETAKDMIYELERMEEDQEYDLSWNSLTIKHLLVHYCILLGQIRAHEWLWYNKTSKYADVNYTKCVHNEDCESVEVGKYYQVKTYDDGMAYVVGTESCEPKLILCSITGPHESYEGADYHVVFEGSYSGYCIGNDKRTDYGFMVITDKEPDVELHD